jgi:hypothetical protein
MSSTPVNTVDDGMRRLDDKGLGNRPSIGRDHED